MMIERLNHYDLLRMITDTDVSGELNYSSYSVYSILEILHYATS